jgi:hypothetical protein
MRTVAAQAPWLSDMYERFGDALLPLIDTRRYLIAGHGSAGILTDWSGNIKIMGVSGTEVILP